MSAPLQFDGLDRVTLPARPLHLAIGMFDGVHLGHQSVIEAAIHSARRSGGLAGVLTFWPHPSALFRPENATKLIMSPAIKRQMLGGMGIDFIIEQNFTRDYAQTEAHAFVGFLKGALPNLAAIYVGENWRFGRERLGNVKLLVEEGQKHGLSVFSAPGLKHNGAAISSSRIRELLAAGEMTEANALLGYSYFSSGTVQPGRQLGRTIGFPTLNLAWEPELRPRYGVYAVTVTNADGETGEGVANYGVRPTVETTASPLLEVHLLGKVLATYGDAVTVNWMHFLRPELKFGGIDELRAQIALDRANAVDFFLKNKST
ncbi:riboflavin biosynthesis protein RibF [Oleiharenicola lentus]|uniref:riboflavin biosynthesis protein RibF n=1 Tax=Oleiharenicola lentus TaxID=2508720 RepID=UPI003F663FB9